MFLMQKGLQNSNEQFLNQSKYLLLSFFENIKWSVSCWEEKKFSFPFGRAIPGTSVLVSEL